jgi:hypothetical protein
MKIKFLLIVFFFCSVSIYCGAQKANSKVWHNVSDVRLMGLNNKVKSVTDSTFAISGGKTSVHEVEIFNFDEHGYIQTSKKISFPHGSTDVIDKKYRRSKDTLFIESYNAKGVLFKLSVRTAAKNVDTMFIVNEYVMNPYGELTTLYADWHISYSKDYKLFWVMYIPLGDNVEAGCLSMYMYEDEDHVTIFKDLIATRIEVVVRDTYNNPLKRNVMDKAGKLYERSTHSFEYYK